MTKSVAAANLRENIVWLWLMGSSAMDISKQMGVSLSTVYRWVRRWQEEGTVENRQDRRRYKCNQYAHRKWMDDSTLSSSLFPKLKVQKSVHSQRKKNTRRLAYYPYISHYNWPYRCFSQQLCLLQFLFLLHDYVSVYLNKTLS